MAGASTLRRVARALAGVAGFAVLCAVSISTLAATGRPDHVGIVIALGVLIGAFSVLGWGVGASGARSCRLALACATLAELYLWSGLPVPRSAGDLPGHLAFAALIAANGGAAFLLHRSPGAARLLMVATSLWCTVIVARLLGAVTPVDGSPSDPAYVLALFMVLSAVAPTWLALWAARRALPFSSV